MKRSILILLPVLFILSCRLFAQSPGGIKGQSFWLQGNFSPGKTGTGILNFNPATILDDAKTPVKLPDEMESLKRVTIFTVYQNTGTVAETPVWEMAGDFGDMALTTNRVSSISRKTNLVYTTNKSGLHKPGNSEAIVHTYRSSWSSRPVDNTVSKEAAIRFGSSNASQLLHSSPSLIAEFLLYEKILNEEEVAKVETYLALKYGITLQKNYINASGKIVWDWKKDKNYSHNIAGIARDDQSTLRQKQGTSSGVPGELIIGINKIEPFNSGNNSPINNRDYLRLGG